jgi:hypothetical protein
MVAYGFESLSNLITSECGLLVLLSIFEGVKYKVYACQ